MSERPTTERDQPPCGTARRLKAKRALTGRKGLKRSSCRYCSIWACLGEGDYARRMAGR